MRITINNQKFETNPSGINPNIIFKGTVHDGTRRVVDVYGFNEEEIVKLAKEVKALDKNCNTVHIYGPENIWANRTYIGVKLLE